MRCLPCNVPELLSLLVQGHLYKVYFGWCTAEAVKLAFYLFDEWWFTALLHPLMINVSQEIWCLEFMIHISEDAARNVLTNTISKSNDDYKIKLYKPSSYAILTKYCTWIWKQMTLIFRNTQNCIQD